MADTISKRQYWKTWRRYSVTSARNSKSVVVNSHLIYLLYSTSRSVTFLLVLTATATCMYLSDT